MGNQFSSQGNTCHFFSSQKVFEMNDKFLILRQILKSILLKKLFLNFWRVELIFVQKNFFGKAVPDSYIVDWILNLYPKGIFTNGV